MLRHTNGNSADELEICSEDQPLLPPVSQPNPGICERVASVCYLPKHLCITSKLAILILSWTVLVGALFIPTVGVVNIVVLYTMSLVDLDMSLTYIILYFFVALLYMFYPLSGFLADVYFGRFRTVLVSLCSILCFFATYFISCTLMVYGDLPSGWEYFMIAVIAVSLFGISLGSAGYSSNFIQFGLDQLLDVPSSHQSLFVHWAVWCYELSSAVFAGVLARHLCYDHDDRDSYLIYYAWICIFSCILSMLLVLGFWKRHLFYSYAQQINPLSVIIKVLNFAKKHKYPLQRSAFTYCDDEKPSRLDFGKERFGGPFTTEQVEDVKTFFRIIGVLLSIGLVFVLDVPTSTVSLLFIGRHITSSSILGNNCDDWKAIVMNSGLLRCIIRVVFFPIYMWVNFVLLRRNVPRILFRLGLGIVVYLMGVLSILAVDIIGHIHYQRNDTQCIFKHLNLNDSLLYYPVIHIPGYDSVPIFTSPALNLHWSVLLPSNILLGIGPSVVTATAYEFISAQSPHSMKGLLLGALFAITGIFEFIGSIAIAPFSSQLIYNDNHSPAVSCLTSYFITISFIALVGLVLFSVVAKKYKYRERDDRPYDQRFVIDVYSRYLN